jgi:hypothetical protein
MPKIIDMTGWVMAEHGQPESRLTVLRRAEDHITKGGNRQIQWLCECSCYNEKGEHPKIIVRGNALRNGNTKSCGCIHKEQLIQRNLENSSVKVGNKYGKLTVIQDLGLREQTSRDKRERWSLCQCDCGSAPIEVKNNMLQNGWKKSCGCLQSQGEFVIEKILKENNLSYAKEFSFSNLTGVHNQKLRFDFAVFQDDKILCLIEFDGRQHYTGPEAGWHNGQSLEEIQEHDKRKNEYCLKNNLLLKRVPYFDIKNVSYDTIFNSTQYDLSINNLYEEIEQSLKEAIAIIDSALQRD